MMRRRQEREESARVLEDQMETSSEYPDEAKPEVDIFPLFLKTVYPASILSSVKKLKASITDSGLYRIHFIC